MALNRREFLKRTGLGTVGLSGLSVLKASGATLAASLTLEGCALGAERVREVIASPQLEEITLPAPRTSGEVSLEETLATRRS
ncbi:MAG: hypothetical protein ACETWB_05645, partial [Anaerolineae bacterium]